MDWGSRVGETGGWEDLTSQCTAVAFRRGLDTRETHLLQRASRINSNAGRLAPPAPLFAAAILPGAAAAVSIAGPLFLPGPGAFRVEAGP